MKLNKLPLFLFLALITFPNVSCEPDKLLQDTNESYSASGSEHNEGRPRDPDSDD